MDEKQRPVTTPFVYRTVFLITGLYSLPILLPSLFGWMLGLLAVPVAWLLGNEQHKQSGIILTASLLPVVLLSLITGRLLIFLGMLPLVPLGYSLYISGEKKRSPAAAACFGILTLGGCLLLFWILYLRATGIHPYRQLVDMMDAAFVAAGDAYLKSGEVPVDMQQQLTAVLVDLRTLLPKILPGILFSMLLFTVWMNEVIWNGFLLRRQPHKAPWPPYREWQLPEILVWLPITVGAAYVFGPESWKNIALNGLIVSAVIYFFQGLAVLLHLLARWNVPGYFKLLLYGMLVIQSYGLILLSLLGVADIWFNLRPATGPLDRAGPAKT